MKKLLSLLFLSFFINAEESRMTPLEDLVDDLNSKKMLYLSERCLSINAGISEGTIGDENEKMSKEASVKAEWFLNNAIKLYASIYDSTEPDDIHDIIMLRASKMLNLYSDYMDEDYLLSGDPYGEPLMEDSVICEIIYDNPDRTEHT